MLSEDFGVSESDKRKNLLVFAGELRQMARIVERKADSLTRQLDDHRFTPILIGMDEELENVCDEYIFISDLEREGAKKAASAKKTPRKKKGE